MTVEEYFAGQEDARLMFDALCSAIGEIGPFELQVSKSQVAFRRGKAFAWAWRPGKYLHGKVAPLVLTLSFPSRDPSPRWKEIVEPQPGSFTHHLELYSVSDIDDQVLTWLTQAYLTTETHRTQSL